MPLLVWRKQFVVTLRWFGRWVRYASMGGII